jgi:hypothetical protein
MNPLQRLYRTKLALLATVFVAVGLALLVLANWLGHTTASGMLVDLLREIGTALFAGGVVLVGFEYVDRRDGEERANRRLRKMLTEEAPAIRDAVIRGFAFKGDDLARVAKVSSPAVLDQIAQNVLAIQLGDRDLAVDAYTDLRAQVIQAPERWHDVHVSATLSPWEQGPRSGRGAMFVATVRWEYRVAPASPMLRFASVSDPAEYRELLRDPTTTGVWYFDPSGGLDGGSSEAFAVVDVSVDGRPQATRRTQRAGAQTYTANIGARDDQHPGKVTISYTYRTLVQRHSHLLYLDISRPTKGFEVDFWYGGAGIQYVNVADSIASSRPTRIRRSAASVPTPSVSVAFDGWLFPKSGVAFVWVLKDELLHPQDNGATGPHPKIAGKGP